jgi:hypothetical protein
MDPQAEDPFHRVRDDLNLLGFGPVIDRVEGNGTLFPVMHNGPGGHDGAILTSWHKGTEPDLIGYFPSRQLWTQVSDIVWVGTAPDGKVNPDDLENGNPWSIPGTPMRMADGQYWVVPMIRRAGSHFLPTELYWDVSGKLVTPIKARFRSLYDESGYFFDTCFEALMGDGGLHLHLERALTFACDCLALRYRFTKHSQTALKVIDETNLRQVLHLAIGFDLVENKLKEWMNPDQKKKRICA